MIFSHFQTTFQQAGICIHVQCIPRDLAESSRRENAHLLVNPIPKLNHRAYLKDSSLS